MEQSAGAKGLHAQGKRGDDLTTRVNAGNAMLEQSAGAKGLHAQGKRGDDLITRVNAGNVMLEQRMTGQNKGEKVGNLVGDKSEVEYYQWLNDGRNK
jgi:hypothetical protein